MSNVATGSNSTISGFTLTTQMTASIVTNVFAQQLVPAYYHYSVNLDVGQNDLFNVAQFYDSGDDVTVTLRTNSMSSDSSGNAYGYNATNSPGGMGVVLQTAALANHNTDVETSTEANFITEWSGITGSNATLMSQTSNNTRLLAGYHNNTEAQFSSPLVSGNQTLGSCLLDIIAKSLFNHPGSKAAIANDSTIKNLSVTDVLHSVNLYESIDTQLYTIFQTDAQSIFDQYVSEYADRYATAVGTSDPNFNDVGSSAAKDFNFVGLTFYVYLIFNTTTLAVMTNAAVQTTLSENPYKPYTFASLPDPDINVVDDLTRIIRLDFNVSQLASKWNT